MIAYQPLESPTRPQTERPSSSSSRTRLIVPADKRTEATTAVVGNDTTKSDSASILHHEETVTAVVGNDASNCDSASLENIEPGNTIDTVVPVSDDPHHHIDSRTTPDVDKAEIDQIAQNPAEATSVVGNASETGQPSVLQEEEPVTTPDLSPSPGSHGSQDQPVESEGMAETRSLPEPPHSSKPNMLHIKLYQTCCSQGNEAAVRELLQEGADPVGYVDQASKWRVLCV